MRKVVYKYEIPPPDPQTKRSVVELPVGYKVLQVAAQGDSVMPWALVDPAEPARRAPVPFKVVATGEPFIDHGWEHLGTAFMHDGALVWHVFREG